MKSLESAWRLLMLVPSYRKFRRRALLSVSLIGTLLCTLVLVGALTVIEKSTVEGEAKTNATGPEDLAVSGSTRTAGLVAMGAMVLYIFVYGVGLGPIPYCYAAGESYTDTCCRRRTQTPAAGGVHVHLLQEAYIDTCCRRRT